MGSDKFLELDEKAAGATVRAIDPAGWVAHYVIGIGYAALLVVLWGREWLVPPTVLPPMTLAICLLVLPYFVMMPGMGMGVAASKTPKPNIARLKSVADHSAFGLGIYATALMLAGDMRHPVPTRRSLPAERRVGRDHAHRRNWGYSWP